MGEECLDASRISDTSGDDNVASFVFTGTVLTGTVNDVQVTVRGEVKCTLQERHIRVASAIEYATAEIEADSSYATPFTPRRSNGVLRCPNRCKRYRMRPALKEHRKVCPGPDRDKSVVACAAAMVLELLQAHDLGVYTYKRKHPHLETVQETTPTIESVIFPSFWALRPKQGKALRVNTTELYECDLASYFRTGANNKGNKMSGAMMRAALLEKYPRRYDIPLEQHINGTIENLFGKGSSARRDVARVTGSNDTTRGSISVQKPVGLTAGGEIRRKRNLIAV